MNLNKHGFNLIESLFSFSIFITIIILLVSLYVTDTKTNTRIINEYSTYQTDKQKIEATIHIEEGIEQCLKKALH